MINGSLSMTEKFPGKTKINQTNDSVARV